jgi:hypothetical protein
MSFIKLHLVKNIKNQIEEKQNSINFSGFFYFDTNIKSKNWYINRVNLENAFPYEKIYPLTFWSLDGKSLVEIYQRLKNNDFYLYKKINGKDHKIRLKKNENNK